MQKYTDTILIGTPNSVAPVAGIVVTIVNTSGGSSQMYSDNGITPISEAVTDTNGFVSFYAADGTYSITRNNNGIISILSAVILYDNSAVTGALHVGANDANSGTLFTTVQGEITYEQALNPNIEYSGASSTGTAAANATAINAALVAYDTVEVPARSYSTNPITVPSNKAILGKGFLSIITGQIIAGAQNFLRNLQLYSTSTINLEITSGADEIVVEGVELINTAGYTTTINLSGTNGFSLNRSYINASGYGLLTNNLGLSSPSASSRIRVQDNFITSLAADAIELNHPSAVVTGAITSGNFLSTTGTGGGGSAGFAFGNAATYQWSFVNNIILDSQFEAIHIEDIQQGGTVVGNSVKGRTDGLLCYPNVTGLYSGAFPIVGNNFLSATASTNSGVSIKYASPYNAINGVPIVGNVSSYYANGFRYWASLTAVPNIILSDNNHSYNCTNAMLINGGNIGKVRQYGAHYSHGATTLCLVTGGTISGGKFYSDSTPTNVLYNASGYAGFMPSCIDGSAFPLAAFTTSAGVAHAVNLNLLTGANNRFFGRIKCEFRRSGIADWIFISANVLWDGTTLTVSNILQRNGGAGGFTNVYFTFVANLNLYFTTTNASAFDYNWREFDGEFYDA